MRSTKQTKAGIATPGDGVVAEGWRVVLHPEVAKDVTDYGLTCPDFTPTLRELITELESNPKQFPKKDGKLRMARAAKLRYRNVPYRAVFVINEDSRTVRIVCLEPRATVYKKAERRI